MTSLGINEKLFNFIKLHVLLLYGGCCVTHFLQVTHPPDAFPTHSSSAPYIHFNNHVYTYNHSLSFKNTPMY